MGEVFSAVWYIIVNLLSLGFGLLAKQNKTFCRCYLGFWEIITSLSCISWTKSPIKTIRHCYTLASYVTNPVLLLLWCGGWRIGVAG